MKTVSTNLMTYLTQGQTTLAWMWAIKRRDGTTLAFTTHDQNIVYDAWDGLGNLTYLATSGFNTTAVSGKSDLSVDNMEVTGFLDSPYITEADLRAGKYDDATIYIRVVNWNDLTAGDVLIRAGTLGVVQMAAGMFTAEIRGLTYKLTTTEGDLYGPMCRAQLGSGAATSPTWIQSNSSSAAGSSCLPLTCTLPNPITNDTYHYQRVIAITVAYDTSAITLSDSNTDTYTQITTCSSTADHGTVVMSAYISYAPVATGSLTLTMSGTVNGNNAFATLCVAELHNLYGSDGLLPVGNIQSLYQPSGTMTQTLMQTTGTYPYFILVTAGWFDLLTQNIEAGCSVGAPINNVVSDPNDGSSYQQTAVGFQTVDTTGVYSQVWTNPVNSKNIVLGFSIGLVTDSLTGTSPAGVQYLCHVPLPLWTQSSNINAVVDGRTLTPATTLLMPGSSTPAATAPAGWFNYGLITFTSGVLSGLSYEIKSWDGSYIVLYLPMAQKPSGGDTFTIQPGCDHTIGPSGCQKFNNVVNFRGEPNMPTMDTILSTPDA
jgi:hypothetical protein